MKSRQTISCVAILALGLAVACGHPNEPDLSDEYVTGKADTSGETVVRWSQNTFALLTTLDSGAPSGLQLIRELPMVHLALHDAANAVDSHFETYALDITDPGADPALAAAAGAHAMLVALRPGKAAQADAFLQVDRDKVANADVAQRSLDLGAAAADAILAARANDHFFDVVPYTFGAPAPGVWQPVPPAGSNAVGTQLPFVTPLGLNSGSQFRAAPPPALTSSQWRTDYNEVKDFGRSDSTVRTADQTKAALFWREQTQFAWNTIARTIATQRNKNLWDTARAFALLNMGLFDGTIANFDTKYHYEYWRPFTAIREIDDGRTDTVMDPAWLPLNNTPGHPEYNSAQGTLGAVSAFPLNKIFGNTSFTITTSTADPPGSTRTFANANAAVVEGANSRIWGGIHFRASVGPVAQNQGKAVGDFLFKNFLQEAEDDDDDDD